MWPFSFFKSLAKSKPTIAPSQVAPNAIAVAPIKPATTPAGISYNPQLISKLKGDHQELFAIYTRLHGYGIGSNLAKIAPDLIVFRRTFTSHILLENVRFYVYLERLLINHPEEKNYVRSLRKDMNGIAAAVSAFCEKWITTPVTTSTQSAFTAELQGIGSALTDQVELEESKLYTLYVESM